MLSENAVKYYRNGYNCSKCIIKAAEDEYGIRAGDTALRMMGAVNNGFGIGVMCSVPIACVAVLGALYKDEAVLKRKRLDFLVKFRKEFGGYNCSEILPRISTCEMVIAGGCNILSGIVGK